MENTLLPNFAKVSKTEKMTEIEKFIQVKLSDEKTAEEFDYKPGQFFEISVMGVGEAPVSVCSIGVRMPRHGDTE